MSESNIGLNADGSGKKLRTFKTTIGANDVNAEAVITVDS